MDISLTKRKQAWGAALALALAMALAPCPVRAWQSWGAAARDAAPAGTADIRKEAREAYIARLRQLRVESDNAGYYCGYFLFDIDLDGIPELWVTTGGCEADREFRVYTFRNGGTAMVYQDANGHSLFYVGSDYAVRMCAHMGYSTWTRYTYQDGGIRAEVIFEEEVDDPNVDYTYPEGRPVEEYPWDDTSPIERALAD